MRNFTIILGFLSCIPSCIASFCTPPTVQEATLQSDIIFVGEIIEKFDQDSRLFNSFGQTDSIHRISFANFKVLKVHRYWESETPHILSVLDANSYIDGKFFYQKGTEIGDTLLVYANFSRPLTFMTTRNCSRTANINFLEKEDLELLQNESHWKKPEKLHEENLNKFQKMISPKSEAPDIKYFGKTNMLWVMLIISVLGNLLLFFNRK